VESAVTEQTDLLLKMMEQLRDDFQDEREASRQSRTKLHERVDGISDDIGAIRGDIRILGEVDGQVRGEVQALSKRVDNAQPTLEEWRRIRAIGIGLVGLLALGGMSVGAALAWAGEGVVNAIRQWLRIG
jgi:predicted nuclease with TOPRIM domain